jgi:hypothetical protein
MRANRKNHPPQSKSAVADFDHFIEWPKPAYTRFRQGECKGRFSAAEGSPGWGDGDAASAEALPPPPGPLTRADLPPPGGGGQRKSDRVLQR